MKMLWKQLSMLDGSNISDCIREYKWSRKLECYGRVQRQQLRLWKTWSIKYLWVVKSEVITSVSQFVMHNGKISNYNISA